MASQVVTIFSIGGKLADEIQTNLTLWSQARIAEDPSEWSPEQWPDSIRAEVDAFVEQLLNFGLEPPVLYRSQHVDLWSMGDVFDRALNGVEVQLLTDRFELFSKPLPGIAKAGSSREQAADDDSLSTRIREAEMAWPTLDSGRIIIVVREVLRGLWTDQEVESSLDKLPEWWTRGKRI